MATWTYFKVQSAAWRESSPIKRRLLGVIHEIFNVCGKRSCSWNCKNIAGNRIKPALGRSLEKPHLEFGLEYWNCISIIMPEGLSSNYLQVAKFHKKDFRVSELYITWKVITLWWEVPNILDIERKTEIMSKFKLPNGDIEKLRNAVAETKRYLLPSFDE